jgi:predicted metal-binding membrane protein
MWVLLSSRLRTWLVLAIAVPLARAVLRRASASASRRDPNSTAARGLRSMEAGLSRLDRRGRRRR